jgi:uncharacterized protein (DUF2141 family)
MFVSYMTKSISILLVFLTLQSFAAKAQDKFLLVVTVKGFKSTKGTVKLQMVDENNKEIFTKIDRLTEKSYTLTIDVFKVGKYAINVIHDKNNNNKLDTNVIGIPKEGWGCSNNARGVMGAPKFKDKLFTVNQKITQIINLVHY